MKIYRTIPDSFAKFANRNLPNPNDRIALENLYYRMKYVYFARNKQECHDFNNLNCENKIGKYFYLFPEDAILEGKKLLINYHRIINNAYLVVEYDLPEDIIFKNIGYGDYTNDIFSNYLMETFIEEHDFGDIVLSSNQIEQEIKDKGFIEAFDFFLERLQEDEMSMEDEIDFYQKYLGSSRLFTNRNELLDKLVKSKLYTNFIEQECELVSTPYITNKIIPITSDFISRMRSFEKIAEYYQNLGIDCNFSKEQKDFKNELIYLTGKTPRDTEKVKKLLKEKKYI